MQDANLQSNLEDIAGSLVALYNRNRVPGWEWFESSLSYDNARLSQALLAAYQSTSNELYLHVADESLRFLTKVTTIGGTHVPIGNQGWYTKGGRRPLYDQQPIEAGGMVEAATLAYKVTGSEAYEQAMRQALGWFFGMNTKLVKVYDESTGACSDGINETGLNQNQGAESTLAFLLAAEAFIENLGEERNWV
jgi:uncharacterized protein YyaL (SSP411 family)